MSHYTQVTGARSHIPDFCDALSYTPTINGSARTPRNLWRASQGDADDWIATFGTSANLANAGSGSVITKMDHSLKFNAGEFHQSTSQVLYNLGSDDFVFEMVSQLPPNNDGDSLFWFAGGNNANDHVAWYWDNTLNGGAGGISCDFRAVTAAIQTRGPSGLTPDNSWVHVMYFVNRDEASTNGSVCYVNGAAGTGVDPSSEDGELTPNVLSGETRVGGGGFESLPALNGQMAWLACWHGASMIQAGSTGKDEIAALAAARAALLEFPTY